ncbi:MAG: ABC transporter ATP-binding protein [Chloroflexi bacterium]|nr:MAG: ABC transporter ATP-binding protein [Chloroflexota bacterium]
MGDVALRAEGLGKQYRIGGRQKYKALRDTLTDAIYFPVKMARSMFTASDDKSRAQASLWALKDVSFEIGLGEVVGVIGRNGAGKSTLLKILSRITEPTEGFVDIHGRVGSLLEVGTGFHPELTGRENIYLNGSIIGMKRREIHRKFDEIVAFAEIEPFLDSPVKYYSSGMYMRLAFAVAAHLEPEIVLLDEVLAVGDAVFQKKCVGRMSEIAREGRTVLFVSHNMATVRSLCDRCVLFEKGRFVFSGSPDECIQRYLSQCDELGQPSVAFPAPSKRRLWMRSATIMCNGAPSTNFFMGDSITIVVDFASEVPIRQPRVAFVLKTQDGISVLNSSSRYQSSLQYDVPVCDGTIHCDLGMVPLAAGNYVLTLYFGDQGEDTHVVEQVLSFEVAERDIWGQGQVPPPKVSCLWWPTTYQFVTTSGSNRLSHAS